MAETWITIPRDRWPKSWANIPDPVVRLERNLYGHPLAGLLWEKFCQKSILNAGFEKVLGWECLYVHYAKQLFLSVYVDDFRMVGKSENIDPMFKDLGKTLELEPLIPSTSNTLSWL